MANITATAAGIGTAGDTTLGPVGVAYEMAVSSNPALRAFAHLPDTAPAAGTSGPLAGLAVGVKDIIDTADMPTGYGSRIDPAHVPAADAWIVARIRELGGTVLGKTVTTEFAWRSPGATVNPHNSRHTPGGSSSGSAAAVAAGIVPLALGTQTIGSVIRPAAYCGVVGYKPSYGSIPRTGVHPLSWSLDHVGLFAREVATIAKAYGLFAAADPSDPHGDLPAGTAPEPGSATVAAERPRIAVIEPPAWDRVDPHQRALRDRAAAALTAAGATLEPVALDALYAQTLDDIMTVLRVEGRHIYEERVERFPDRTSDHLKALVADGAGISAKAYVAALENQKHLRRAMADHFAGYDAILTVPATGEAPEGLDNTGDPALSAPWTFTGAPAISLPAGFGPNGLPLGIQLVAPWSQDRQLLSVAAFAEATLATMG